MEENFLKKGEMKYLGIYDIVLAIFVIWMRLFIC